MGAHFPRMPRESALFSRAWKRTSLGIVPYQGTATASAPQTPWGVPWFVAPQGISGGDSRITSHCFLCDFMGCSSESSMKFDRNSTTEKSVDCEVAIASEHYLDITTEPLGADFLQQTH